MSKPLAALLLALCLCLGTGAAALASPPVAPAEGVFVFADYAPAFFFDDNFGQVGVGYAFSPNFAAGVEYMAVPGDPILGAFADLRFGPLAVDVNYQSAYGISAYKLTGLYLLQLNKLRLGLGGGTTGSGGSNAQFFELAADYTAGPVLLYGAVDKYVNGPGNTVFKAGACFTF